MVEIIGLILGVVGIVFAFERPRAAFLSLFGSKMLAPLNGLGKVSQVVVNADSHPVHGATQSGRYPFFISEPLTDLESAKAESRRAGKPLFLVIYDGNHPSKSQLYYSLGCFLDYFTTKKLIEDHFVSALVSSQSNDVAALVPEDNPLENCLWVVLSPGGAVLRREGLYANPDEGLKRVRSVIAESLHS